MNTTTRGPLDSLRIASPCSADWSRMSGTDQKRFCAECKLHVHDLSAMTTDEALTLLRDAGQGRLCVRFYRRADGRVLTRDCPVGLRQKLRRMWTRAAALALGLWGAVACSRGPAATEGGEPVELPGTFLPPLRLDPPSQGDPGQAVRMGEAVMGDVLVRPTEQPPAGTEVLQGKIARPEQGAVPPQPPTAQGTGQGR